MADYLYTGLGVVVRVHPGDDQLIDLGVLLDGEFQILGQMKAGRLERHKARAAEKKSASGDPVTGSPAALEG
jgi:hypothetical protein